jgi:hypothetical protein
VQPHNLDLPFWPVPRDAAGHPACYVDRSRVTRIEDGLEICDIYTHIAADTTEHPLRTLCGMTLPARTAATPEDPVYLDTPIQGSPYHDACMARLHELALHDNTLYDAYTQAVSRVIAAYR